MGFQPLAMTVGIIVLREGSLQRTYIEHGLRTVPVQPRADMVQILSEFLPVIDEISLAVNLDCLKNNQVCLIQYSAEILFPVALSVPKFFQ